MFVRYENSSRVGEVAREVDREIERAKKRKIASSPVEKEVDRVEQLRKMKEVRENTSREYQALMKQVEKIKARMDQEQRDIEQAEIFFADDGKDFQVVGKKKQGKKTGTKGADSQVGGKLGEGSKSKSRKVREWTKNKNDNLGAIFEEEEVEVAPVRKERANPPIFIKKPDVEVGRQMLKQECRRI